MRDVALTESLVDVGGLQPHEVRQLVDDHFTFGGGFVHALDAPPLPVRPVNVIAQESEAKYMRELVLDQDPASRPVHVHHLRQTWREGCFYLLFMNRNLHTFEYIPAHGAGATQARAELRTCV